MGGEGGGCITNSSVIPPALSLFSLNWSLGNSLTLVCYETETTQKRIIRRKPLNSSYSKTQAAPSPLPTGRKAPLISLLEHQVVSPPPGTENAFQGHIPSIDSKRAWSALPGIWSLKRGSRLLKLCRRMYYILKFIEQTIFLDQTDVDQVPIHDKKCSISTEWSVSHFFFFLFSKKILSHKI